jgi:hypothetical protein
MSLDQYFKDLRATNGSPELALVSDRAPCKTCSPAKQSRRIRSHSCPSYGPLSVPARQDSRQGISEEMFLWKTQRPSTQQEADKVLLEEFYEAVTPSMALSPRKSHSFHGTTKNKRWAGVMGSSSDLSLRRTLLKGIFSEALKTTEKGVRNTKTTPSSSWRGRGSDHHGSRTMLSDCLIEAEQILDDDRIPQNFRVISTSRSNSFHVRWDARWSSRPLLTSNATMTRRPSA